MIDFVRRRLLKLRSWFTRDLEARLDAQSMAIGALHAERVRALPFPPPAHLPPAERLQACEFQVFSQWGDDGILQYLVHHLPMAHRTFVEFGVESYREANTRFLLAHDHWQGFVMDGSAELVEGIRRDDVHWRHDLQVRQAFVTRENIDALLRESGFDPDLGLLSIDIDGNDWWVWDAITAVRPRIVVCEYIAIFGHDPVTVPYDPAFQRMQAHPSGLYCGASLSALDHLARKKGYVLAGCDGGGVNAFFVRADIAPAGLAVNAAEAWVECHVRQARDERGQLTFARGAARRALIAHLPVVDVKTGATRPLG